MNFNSILLENFELRLKVRICGWWGVSDWLLIENLGMI
jgi:hypothetical protein